MRVRGGGGISETGAGRIKSVRAEKKNRRRTDNQIEGIKVGSLWFLSAIRDSSSSPPSHRPTTTSSRKKQKGKQKEGKEKIAKHHPPLRSPQTQHTRLRQFQAFPQ